MRYLEFKIKQNLYELHKYFRKIQLSKNYLEIPGQ